MLGAIAEAATTASVAPAAGGLTFAWEVNLTTVTVFASGALTWWLTVLRLGDQVKGNKLEIAMMKRDVESAEMRALKLEGDIRVLREEVYKEYLSVATWRQINQENREDAGLTEKRIMGAIADLTRRVDNFAHGIRPK